MRYLGGKLMNSRSVMKGIKTTMAEQFSLGQASGLVKSFYQPIAWIYWVDFLASVIVGHVLFNGLLYSDLWLSGSVAFVWSVKICLYVAIVAQLALLDGKRK